MHPGVIYVASVGFAAGVALQTLFPLPFWGLYVLALLALTAAVLSRLCPQSPAWRRRFSFIALALILATLGAWRMDVAALQLQDHSLAEHEYQEVTRTGHVVREPEIRPDSLHLHVALPDTRLLLIVDRLEEVSYGDVVTFTGRLDVPEPFPAELGRTFPYDGYLGARGITHVLFYPELEVVGKDAGNLFIALLLQNKHAVMERIEAVIPEPEVALGEGLLLGVRRAMSEETLEQFRSTGIIHIVVLSGFNVMLVVAFMRYVFGSFLSLRPRVVATMLAIVCYAITVGLTATVVRASIMVMLLLVAQYLGRTYEAIRGLFVAGALMIAFNPYLLIYDIGFQLSFVATLGLILVAPHLETMLTTVPNKIGTRSYVIATIATQIAVMPLLLYHVGEFSVVAPLVNLLVLPAVPVAMLFVFLTGVVSLVSLSLAQPFAFLAYLSLRFILVVSEFFAELPFAAFWVPAFSFALVPLGYALMAWGYWYYTTRPIAPAGPAPIPRRDTATAVDLAGWTIVDKSADGEEESGAKQNAAAPQRGAAAENDEDTPVFFR